MERSAFFVLLLSTASHGAVTLSRPRSAMTILPPSNRYARVLIQPEDACDCQPSAQPKSWDTASKALAGVGTAFKLWKSMPQHWRDNVISVTTSGTSLIPAAILATSLAQSDLVATALAFFRDSIRTLGHFFS